jgi:hypothetical protein
MAYDFLLKVVENGLTASKTTNSFNGGKGSMVEVRMDVKAISGTDASVKVIVQLSDDNVNFSDSFIKEFNTVTLNNKLSFKKQKAYHRLNLVLSGTSPSVDIELNQR